MLVNKPTLDMTFRLTTRLAHARLATLAGAALALFSACAGPTPPAEGTGAPVYVGAIEAVNREKSSVVIDPAAEGAPLQAGTDLTAISREGEAVRLKVTGEGKRSGVSAAIVSGNPKAGQRVYR